MKTTPTALPSKPAAHSLGGGSKVLTAAAMSLQALALQHAQRISAANEQPATKGDRQP
ncbi:MAG: hypothetical protein V4662_17815 [Verrucomicrobiota bacterium]